MRQKRFHVVKLCGKTNVITFFYLWNAPRIPQPLEKQNVKMNSMYWSVFPDVSRTQTLFITSFFSLNDKITPEHDGWAAKFSNVDRNGTLLKCPAVSPSWIIHHVCWGCNLKEQEQVEFFLQRIHWSVPLFVFLTYEPLNYEAPTKPIVFYFLEASLHILTSVNLTSGGKLSGSLRTPEHDFWTASFPPPLLFIYVLLVITLQLSATSSRELVCMLPFLTWAVNNSDYGHKSQ